jgi:hypothetical protein
VDTGITALASESWQVGENKHKSKIYKNKEYRYRYVNFGHVIVQWIWIQIRIRKDSKSFAGFGSVT